ncbi:MAG: PilZ domain-containing protein [Candidatus Hydrogenedentota bacterium]
MERRRHIRHAIEIATWLYEPRERRPLLMRSADLSLSGVRLTWLRPLLAGTPLLVCLQLGENGPAIECKGHVCWCALLKNGLHHFGVRFLDITEDESQQLEEFLRVSKARPVLAAV